MWIIWIILLLYIFLFIENIKWFLKDVLSIKVLRVCDLVIEVYIRVYVYIYWYVYFIFVGICIFNK